MSRFARRLERSCRSKRVVLQRPEGIDRFGSRGDELAPEGLSERDRRRQVAEYQRERSRAEKSKTKIQPVVRLTEHGIDWGAAPRPGDEIGYGMDPFRSDDCLQAAIATATQIPIEEVPDLQLDRRCRRGDDRDEISRSSWLRIDQWAKNYGLVPMFWEGDELPVPRDRWIGVVACKPGRVTIYASGRAEFVADDDEGFSDHCLVMSHDRLVFDPSCSVKPPPGLGLLFCTPDQITYGISFDKEE